ncbi:uncharacterized protein LOC135687522 isoform X2 [Rhopilema esculentum]
MSSASSTSNPRHRMSSPHLSSNSFANQDYDILNVELTKAANTGLGIGVGCSGKRGADSYGIFIHHVAEGSVAQKDGRIRKGDHILEVNSQGLYQATLDEAYNILGNLQPGTVVLKVKRRKRSTSVSRKPSSERSVKAQSDAGVGALAKWGKFLDLRNPSTPKSENLSDLMTPARHLSGIERKGSLKSSISVCTSDGSDNANDDSMSFASFISQSKLPSAVRVRVASTNNPAILDEAYKSTTAANEPPISASNVDGWTSIPPPPLLSDDESTIGDTVQKFNETSAMSKSIDKYHNPGKIVEFLMIDKQKSFTGSLGMGVSVEKRTDTDVTGKVYVKTILPGGAAELATGGSSGIQEGDEVLEVNGKELSGLSQEQVVRLFKEMPSKCEIVVRRACSTETSHHISIQPVSIVPSPLQQKKESPDIQVTIDKSSAPATAASYEVPNIINDTPNAPSMPYIRRRSVIPGLGVEEDASKARLKKKRLGQLSESFKESTDSYPDEMKLLIKTVENMSKSEGLQDPLQTSLTASDSLAPNKVTKSNSIRRSPSTTTAPFEETGPMRSNLMPLQGDIPDGFNAHLIELEKKEKSALGISLVPSHDSCAGYFQVRRIMPGSVSEADGRIQVGDYIYSVNGNVMKDLSHPAALQVLKHSGTSVKIVIFRDKEEDIRIQRELEAKKSESDTMTAQSNHVPRPPRMMKRESRDALIPGFIRGETKLHLHHNNHSPLIRHSTIDSISSDSPSTSAIPHLEDRQQLSPRVRKLDLAQKRNSLLGAVKENGETAAQKLRKSTSLEIEEQKVILTGARNKFVDSTENQSKSFIDYNDNDLRSLEGQGSSDNNDEDESDLDEVSRPGSSLNASLLTYGQRSEIQAFVIEYQRMFKGLGIKVMLDEEEEVMITEVSPSGLVGKDGNIRTGDILLSINGEEVNGKPISKVQEMISSVPRGNVQLIAKSSNLSEEVLRRASMSMAGNQQPQVTSSLPPKGDESIFSDESDFQALAPPPPPVFNPQSLAAPQRILKKNLSSHKGFRDDFSDMESLPGAPPPPILPTHLFPSNSGLQAVEESFDMIRPPSVFGENVNEDSDTDSIFTALPPPPPKPLTKSSNENSYRAHHVLSSKPEQYGVRSSNSDVASSLDSESTIRGQNSQFGIGSSESEASIVPPPPLARFDDPELSAIQETAHVLESENFATSNQYLMAVDGYGYDDDDDDDRSSLYSIPDPPPAPSLSRPASELSQTGQSQRSMTSRSESMRSNYSTGSVSSALNFLDSTLLPHTDGNETPKGRNTGSVNSQLLSPPIWSTTPEASGSSPGERDELSPMSLSSSKSLPYGSYTDLSKDSQTHMPIIMGEHFEAGKSVGKKKGFLSKLKQKLITPSKNKPESPTKKDSKGREIVHFTHDKVKSTSNQQISLKSASSTPSIKDVFSDAKEGSLKRTISLDENSMRMLNEEDNSNVDSLFPDPKSSRWSLVSPPSDWQAQGAEQALSNARGLSLESGIDRMTEPNSRSQSKGADGSQSKNNRRRSSAAAGRRMSKTSPPQSPAPPPPEESISEDAKEQTPRKRSFKSRLSSSLGDLSQKLHRSDSNSSVRSRKESTDGPKTPDVSKKPSLKKKPSSPLLNRLRSMGRLGRATPPESPSASNRQASYVVPEKGGSVSSSSTFSGFEDNMGGASKESVARRKKSSKMSLMKFDFPPPPLPGEDSSGDTSSDLSSKKALEERQSPRGNHERDKRFSAVIEEKEVDHHIEGYVNSSPSNENARTTRPPSVVMSEGWGSDFSDLESVRVASQTRSDLADPKLQPFSVPLNEISDDFRIRAKTTPVFMGNYQSKEAHVGNDDSDDGSWGSEFSELKSAESRDSTPSKTPQKPSGKQKKLRKTSSLENISKKVKNEQKAPDNRNNVKLKSPLFNIFTKKDTKAEKKAKNKESRFSALFHGKKHVQGQDIVPPHEVKNQQKLRNAHIEKEDNLGNVDNDVAAEEEPAIYESVELTTGLSAASSIGIRKKQYGLEGSGVEGVDLSDIRLKTMQDQSLMANGSHYENLPQPRKLSPLEDCIDGSIKNPVPKPPRRHEDVQTTPKNEYINLAEYRRDSIANQANIESEPAPDFDIDLMDKLDNFAATWDMNEDDEEEEFRMLPPVPDEDDVLLPSNPEVEELYAKVDKTTKSRLQGGRINGEKDSEDIQDLPKGSRDIKKIERKTSADVSALSEGKFKIQLVRESGCPLGITIVGGSDTPVGILLVSSLQMDSAAGKSNQIRPGDQLLQVNEQDLTDATHADALQSLKNTPPLVELVLLRSKDGNKAVLEKAMKPTLSKPNVIAKPLKEEQKEVILLKPTHSLEVNTDVEDGRNMTLSSKQSEAVKQRNSFGPFSTFQKQLDDEAPDQRITASRAALNKRPSIEKWDNIEIVLEKTSGKGLGIGVTGGSRTKIAEGMTVRKLVPGSIAGDDGRLQQDDKIMSVNGNELKGLTQGEALGMLKNFTNTVTLVVKRKRSLDMKRGYTLSAVDLRPPSPLLMAAMTSPDRTEDRLPVTKSFSHFIERKTKSKRHGLDSISKSFDFSVGGGQNLMYGGDTDI